MSQIVENQYIYILKIENLFSKIGLGPYLVSLKTKMLSLHPLMVSSVVKRTSTVEIHYTKSVQLEKPPTICNPPPRMRLPSHTLRLSCYELAVFGLLVKSVHTRAPV